MEKDINEYFLNRGTVRSYADEEIPEAEIMKMLEVAMHAPNTGNMQWYSVIVTRDEQKKEELAAPHFNQPSVRGASAVLTFCVDLCRFEQWCRLNNAKPGFDNFQSFMAGVIDTSLLAQQFCTIAEMHGYGTCYLGTTTYNAPDISRILELPERVVPVTTVTLGVPEAFPTPCRRLPIEAIVHMEAYSTPGDDKIKEWYAPTEQESQHFVDENGKETLAQVFTDVRYPRESAEYFSKVYYNLIAENRFLFPI